jgi:hypothetical protein
MPGARGPLLALGRGAGLAGAAEAAPPPASPFSWRNASPPVLALGLPRPRPAALPAAGATETELVLEVISHYSTEARGGERVVLDGETHAATLFLERGVGAGWAASVEVPVLRHDGGFLDPLVDGWHDAFGLPEGGRDRAPRGQVTFAWLDESGTRLRIEGATGGLGDVRLGLARALHAAPDRDLALRLSVELPTGDDDLVLGSGGTDVALSLALSDRRWLARAGMDVQLVAGVLRSGDTAVLEDDVAPVAGFGTLGLGLPLGERWVLRGQLDAHTALADSALKQIGGWSVQGGLGVTVRVGGLLLDAAFHEDLRPGSAPDIGFRFGLRGRF